MKEYTSILKMTLWFQLQKTGSITSGLDKVSEINKFNLTYS